MKKIKISNNQIISFQYEKFWKLKDKRIFNDDLGIHWKLKKFIVLYNYLLVRSDLEINKDLFNKISKTFEEFIYSLDDTDKKAANQYFFKPIDLRTYNLNFDEFDNIDNEKPLLARKFLLCSLMPMGGQGKFKKYIFECIQNSKNLSEIKLSYFKKFKDEEIKKLTRDFYDYHGEIRNYRQSLSLLGVLPNDEEGLELNEISTYILNANSYILRALWEHQKLKLRFLNPDYEIGDIEEVDKEFTTEDDFDDFYVSPYISLIRLIELLNNNEQNLTLADYKNILSRESNFNLKTCLSKIIEFKNLNEVLQNNISKDIDNRPKKRDFSKKRSADKDPKEDFVKIIQNLIYGISEYKYNKNVSTNIIKWKNRSADFRDDNIQVLRNDILTNLAIFFKNIEDYLDKYRILFDHFSVYSKVKFIDDIINQSDNDEYIENLENIKKNLKLNIEEELFYLIPLSWIKYFQTVDNNLLLYSLGYLIAIDNFDNKKYTHKLEKLNLHKSIDNKNIEETFLDLKYLNKIIDSFYNKDNNFLVKSNLEINDFFNSYILESKFSSYSSIKEITNRQKFKTSRNQNIINLTKKIRFNDSVIKGQLYKIDDINLCDGGCGNTVNFSSAMHHVIPIDLAGPDDEYNLVCLCKTCHEYIDPERSQNKFKKKEIINNIKLKNVFTKLHIKKLISENKLKLSHLNFLQHEGYIHSVQNIEFRKSIDINKRYEFKLESELISKTGMTDNRWSRAMQHVFTQRDKVKKIMEIFRNDIETSKCDGGCGSDISSKRECHHILPKNQIYKEHNNPKLNGPESPFNYLFLCKNCHNLFTFEKPGRLNVVNNAKKNNLINFETIFRMILDDNINNNHLDFLFNEQYINNNEFSKLNEVFREFQRYSTAFESS